MNYIQLVYKGKYHVMLDDRDKTWCGRRPLPNRALATVEPAKLADICATCLTAYTEYRSSRDIEDDLRRG